jgi:hypothetical protein
MPRSGTIEGQISPPSPTGENQVRGLHLPAAVQNPYTGYGCPGAPVPRGVASGDLCVSRLPAFVCPSSGWCSHPPSAGPARGRATSRAAWSTPALPPCRQTGSRARASAQPPSKKWCPASRGPRKRTRGIARTIHSPPPGAAATARKFARGAAGRCPSARSFRRGRPAPTSCFTPTPSPGETGQVGRWFSAKPSTSRAPAASVCSAHRVPPRADRSDPAARAAGPGRPRAWPARVRGPGTR